MLGLILHLHSWTAYIMLFQPLATQSALQYCLTFTQSYTHSHMHTGLQSEPRVNPRTGLNRGQERIAQTYERVPPNGTRPSTAPCSSLCTLGSSRAHQPRHVHTLTTCMPPHVHTTIGLHCTCTHLQVQILAPCTPPPGRERLPPAWWGVMEVGVIGR